ncbi:MAG: Gfo/Idh/MocA family oxidoreductase [Verrucomicrobiota bacterium]|jgi:predicted dehydrogenase
MKSQPADQTVVPPTGSRRRFLATSGAMATALAVLPAHVLGRAAEKSPNSSPALAGVGVGGVGFGQLQDCEKAGFQVVALCDVDDLYAKKAFDRWPRARRYRDFRELFAAEADRIDAVHVATPDHTHALITLAALRHKKHVCCVKPLTRTAHEGRVLLAAAKQAGVATQMTAAPYTTEAPRRVAEWIQAGLLGAVREVHIWTNRPVWPQGMVRPPGEDPVPDTFDWKLWLGPAPLRPFKGNWPDDAYPLRQLKSNPDWIKAYRGVYHPFNFRGWWDFGTGALGDMGCHHFNPVVSALKPGAPNRVEATCTRAGEETAPLASIVTYDFPARAGQPPVRIIWYDGGLQPPRPVELDEPLPEEGAIYIGDEGKLVYAGQPRLLSPKAAAKAASVPKTLPRRSGTWGEWFEACNGGEPAGCEFNWAVPLTELVLLGNIAIRTGKRLE